MAEEKGGGGSSATTGMGLIIIVIVIIGIMNQVTGGNLLSSNGSIFGNGSNSGSNYKAPDTLEGIQKEAWRIGDDIEVLRKQAEKDARVGQTSPLFKQIDINSSGVWSENPDEEYIELNYSRNAKEKLLLTGMEIKSAESGRGVVIPSGVYRPFFSRSNVIDPIYINPGDKVVLVSGKSPVGYSFKVNKCTGYFSQFNDFSPTLYTSCPLAREKSYPYIPLKYRNACYNYIESIPSCFMPLNFIPEDIGPECTAFVTTEVSYDKCVEDHKFDKDFYLPEWRVYLNRPEEIWLPQREMIKLLDSNKRTINFSEY